MESPTTDTAVMNSDLYAPSDDVNPSARAKPDNTWWHPGYGADVLTLADRIRQILALRSISARELSRRAGLGETQVSVLIKRLDKNPHADVTVPTLQAIAAGAKVSFRWLATGAGAPDDEDAEPLKTTVETGIHPRLGSLANWPDIRAIAERIAPEIPAEAWDRAEAWRPSLSGPLTPAMAVAIARVVLEHEPLSPSKKRGR